MALFVDWVEMHQLEETCFTVNSEAGKLIVYQSDNVITKTEWVFGDLKHVTAKNSYLFKQIQQYINNPATSLTISLQKQNTDFRNRVWTEICNIPAGQVISYSELAESVGSGARAVANACRDNPFPGIIPCHRVVSVNGLGGYMGDTSGRFIDIKRKLLYLESELK